MYTIYMIKLPSNSTFHNTQRKHSLKHTHIHTPKKNEPTYKYFANHFKCFMNGWCTKWMASRWCENQGKFISSKNFTMAQCFDFAFFVFTYGLVLCTGLTFLCSGRIETKMSNILWWKIAFSYKIDYLWLLVTPWREDERGEEHQVCAPSWII